ncbi:trypsin-like serine protease [Candidatus Thiosymbion oneisti]|uniref:trypsin-like serine protease n=1 Tax=Candidatus Thiosymbion oneisti TaxID=589554 RepID=UPI00114CCB28|nr:trypsin-like serine protease [Candidatus Thiosymbion oneisti]
MNDKGMLTDEEINDILDQYSDWLTYDNIVGIDVEEMIDEKTGEKRLELLVDALEVESFEEVLEEKAFRGEKEKTLEIPQTVEIPLYDAEEPVEPVWKEIYTRIRVVDEIVEDELVEKEVTTGQDDAEENGIEEAQAKKRPCPGGYMIRTHGLGGKGSVGTSINYRGKYRLLSNNHVLTKNGNVGKWVYQPTEVMKENRLVKVTGFDSIIYYSTNNPGNPTYHDKDVAWCDSSTDISSQEVRGIGKIKGRRSPRKGETIYVYGGKSEKKYSAKVVSTTYRYRSKGTLGYSFWRNGLKLDRLVTQPGDSGSAYVASSDSKLVGLHRSGNRKHSTGGRL